MFTQNSGLILEPKKYKDQATTRSVGIVSAVLSSSYFAVLITLHRNFLPSNPAFPRPTHPPSSTSLTQVVDAARSVIHTAAHARVVVPPSHHQAVFCQYLWSSAVILLLCEVQARDQVVVNAVASQVEECRRALQALEPVWPGSRKLKQLLEDVVNRAKDVVADPSRKKRKQAPPSKDSPARSSPAKPISAPSTASSLSQALVRPSAAPMSAPPMPLAPYPPQAFDLGGVNFDGLELLQPFSGNAHDSAAFFQGMFPEFYPLQTPVPNQNQPMAMSSSQAYLGSMTPGQNSSGPVSASPVEQSTDPAEFWGQVAGGTFDWGADPNVPFVI